MRYWDSSALVPLFVAEARSDTVEEILKDDPAMSIWWSTPVECYSALSRLQREGVLDISQVQDSRLILKALGGAWTEILPSRRLRASAIRLIPAHGLKAADGLQLAAALTWTQDAPEGWDFVCLDDRLRAAAQSEGFTLLP